MERILKSPRKRIRPSSGPGNLVFLKGSKPAADGWSIIELKLKLAAPTRRSDACLWPWCSYDLSLELVELVVQEQPKEQSLGSRPRKMKLEACLCMEMGRWRWLPDQFYGLHVRPDLGRQSRYRGDALFEDLWSEAKPLKEKCCFSHEIGCPSRC